MELLLLLTPWLALFCSQRIVALHVQHAVALHIIQHAVTLHIQHAVVLHVSSVVAVHPHTLFVPKVNNCLFLSDLRCVVRVLVTVIWNLMFD